MHHPVRLRRIAVAIAVATMGLALPLARTAGQTNARPGTVAASDWIQLFNGRDLADWTIKFAKHELGRNLHNTFRVEDGLLKVRYDGWPSFNGEFGHIFYKDPFSYYLIAAEYRFVGEQVSGAPAWAMRNLIAGPRLAPSLSRSTATDRIRSGPFGPPLAVLGAAVLALRGADPGADRRPVPIPAPAHRGRRPQPHADRADRRARRRSGSRPSLLQRRGSLQHVPLSEGGKGRLRRPAVGRITAIRSTST